MTCRIVFMGSPQFAIPTLKMLYQHFEIVGVFSQADKRCGRGKALNATPVKKLALEMKVNCIEPEHLKNSTVLQILKEWKPDVVVVVAYGKFLPKEILDLPPLGCLNLHASLLPRHRGPSPISAAILAGDNLTGNTIMLLDGGMDTGRILAKQTVEIRAKDSAGDLHDRLMELGAVLMVETLKKLINDEIIPVPQNETEATYSRLLRKTDGLLDWNLSAKQLDRIVRAMDPWPVAYFPLGHEQIKVWRSTVLEGRAEPGLITNVGPQGLVVGTGSGLLRLEEVRAPSRKKIMGSDFARGKRLKPGDYLI